MTFKSVNIYQLDSKSAKYVTVNGSGESVFKPTKSLHNCKRNVVDTPGNHVYTCNEIALRPD